MTDLVTPLEEFTVTRLLSAPRELVFRAWTEIEQLLQWWGPPGMGRRSYTLDLRPGGSFHYAMVTATGQEMWGKWVFREIEPPARLVFVSLFSDPQGGTTRPPWTDNWPLETLSTLTFVARGQQTLLTLNWIPIAATAEERQAFLAAHSSMQQGWGGTLDQLAAYLGQS